jgi:hypothetical protein
VGAGGFAQKIERLDRQRTRQMNLRATRSIKSPSGDSPPRPKSIGSGGVGSLRRQAGLAPFVARGFNRGAQAFCAKPVQASVPARKELRDFAFSSSGLDLTKAEAIRWAMSNLDKELGSPDIEEEA